jgi:DNA-binding LytR/AlgR family response regulator
MAERTIRSGRDGEEADEQEADNREDDLIEPNRATNAVNTGALASPAPPSYLTRLSVRVDERFVLLKMDDIRWLEAAGKYVRVHAGKEVYTLRDSLGRLASLLDPERFLRISREAIVNLDRVRAIETWFHGDYQLRLDGGETLRSTRSFREELKRLLQRRPRQG